MRGDELGTAVEARKMGILFRDDGNVTQKRWRQRELEWSRREEGERRKEKES